MLLERLKNTSLSPSQKPQNLAPNGGAPTRTQATFNVPIVPSPLSTRRFVDDDGVESASIENVHLSVGDSKKQIKLSSDSGLGSSELGDDHQHWKNGMSSFLYTCCCFFFTQDRSHLRGLLSHPITKLHSIDQNIFHFSYSRK